MPNVTIKCLLYNLCVYVEYQKGMGTFLLLLQIRGFLSYRAGHAAILNLDLF